MQAKAEKVVRWITPIISYIKVYDQSMPNFPIEQILHQLLGEHAERPRLELVEGRLRVRESSQLYLSLICPSFNDSLSIIAACKYGARCRALSTKE